MTQADLRTDRRTRWTVAALVTLLHVGLIAGVIRAFTPQLVTQVADAVTQAFTVTPSPTPTPPPEPPAPPRPAATPTAPERDGATGAPGRKAVPRDAAQPAARVTLKPIPAPPLAGRGDENAAGANAQGEGTGAAGIGQGTGAGASGSGQGGGGAGSPTVKIEGDINSARDYPRASRALRIGAAVTIDLTIGTDGRVRACRVVQPSPDAAADRITCELAAERFRFRPARDASGDAVESTYRWRQRWFY